MKKARLFFPHVCINYRRLLVFLGV